MEANVRITDGTEVRYVTPAVANDKALLKRFGFWKDAQIAQEIKAEMPIADVTETQQEPEDLLAVPEMSKNDIMASLKNQGIKFNPADKKETLLKLLNSK